MRGTCQHRAPLIIAETSCVRLSFHQGQNFSVCGQLCGQTKKGPRQLAKPFLFFGDKRACRCGDLISIHAPARGATTAGIGANLYLAFQSTSPTRGTTVDARVGQVPALISIHAPREGGDSRNSQNFKLFLQQSDNFYKYSSELPPFPPKNRATYLQKTPQTMVRDRRDFLCACALHLKHQDVLWVIRRLCPPMLDLVFISGCPSSKSAGYSFPNS